MPKKILISDDEEEMNEEEYEDDDDEDEGEDEYEKDGFIVDDVDEEEQDDGEGGVHNDEERQKKKKRKKRELEKNYVLDEDDYELLEDNNITDFHRPMESKKFKRLKKAERDAEDKAEEKLKRSLFGDGTQLEDSAEEEQPDDEDEMADFIVDEEEVNERGDLLKRRKVKQKKFRQELEVSPLALNEAHEIFGDVDELLKIREKKIPKIDSRSKEPSILSEKLTGQDDEVREADILERMQISEKSTGSPFVDESSINDESSWICNQLATSMIFFLIWEKEMVMKFQ